MLCSRDPLRAHCWQNLAAHKFARFRCESQYSLWRWRGLFLTLNKLHRYYKNESVELVLLGRVCSRRCIANINFVLPAFRVINENSLCFIFFSVRYLPVLKLLLFIGSCRSVWSVFVRCFQCIQYTLKISLTCCRLIIVYLSIFCHLNYTGA